MRAINLWKEDGWLVIAQGTCVARSRPTLSMAMKETDHLLSKVTHKVRLERWRNGLVTDSYMISKG